MWSGIGQKLSLNGSGNVSPIARMLMAFTSGGRESYVAGQEASLKMNHERAVAAAYELDRVQEEELKNARDVFALFGGDITSMTGEDTNITLPQVGKFHDAMLNVARRANDNILEVAIQSNDYKRVENILKERDATSKDLKASLTQQRKDEDRRNAEAPYLENGGPSQAGPPIGDTPVPEDAPTDAAVPREDQPGPSGQPGARPPAAAAAPGRPAPDTSSPDFDPASPERQAAAQPPRPVRLAMAGASDAPLPGVTQTQPQQPPDTMGWQASPSVLNGATNEDGAKYNAGSLDQFARKAINNPLFKPTAKGVYPASTTNMTGWITRRSQQIENDLRRIEQDPRFDPQPGDTDQQKQRKRAAAWRAINSVDPELATSMLGYVNGDNPVPMSQQFAPLRAHIIALGQKIDPTFNANTYANRANIRRDITVGVDGRTMAGIATANAHVQRAIELADELKKIQTPELGPWLTAQQQGWQKNAPPIAGGDAHVRELVNQFNYEVGLIAPEVMRAQKGAAPTQGEVNDFQHLMDASQPADELIGRLRNAQDLFHQRMNQMVQRFTTLSGGKPDSAMMSWFHEFERQGFQFEPPIGGGVQDALPPLMGGGTVTDAIRNFMQERPSGGPITPQRSQDDSDALNWARANPNDPRAKRILQHLGQ